MNTTATVPGAIPEDLKAELREALDDLARGIRHAEKMDTARKEMDRLREENHSLFGETNMAVQLVREARNHA